MVTQNNEFVNQDFLPDHGTASTCSTTAAVNSCEVLLQVIPVKLISNNGSQTTAYGLVDSGSDITVIDPSLVRMLNMKGSPSKLSFTTVNNTTYHPLLSKLTIQSTIDGIVHALKLAI